MQNEINLLPGQIAGFYDKSQFRLGIVVSVGGTEITLCQADGAYCTVPGARIMLSGKEIYTKEPLSETVSDFIAQVAQRVETIKLETIWDAYQTSGILLSFETLAAAKPADDIYTFALFEALAQDRQYFQPKGRQYLARSSEQREQFLAEERQLHLQEVYRQQVERYLETMVKASLSGDSDGSMIELPAATKAALEADLYEHLVHKPLIWLRKLLRQIVVHYFEHSEADSEAQVEELVILLRRSLNQIDSTTPRKLALSGLPVLFAERIQQAVRNTVAFSGESGIANPGTQQIANLCYKPEAVSSVSESSRQAGENTAPFSGESGIANPGTQQIGNLCYKADSGCYKVEPDYLDLTYLDCLTIDAEETWDRDDALSVLQTESGWQVGIHIAEVEYFVPGNSDLDNEAYLRTSSIYLPQVDVPMLPESISCSLASLLPGKTRPAISLLLHLTTDWEIVSTEFVKSAVCIKHFLTYLDCDAMIDEFGSVQTKSALEDSIRILHQLAEKHKARRIAAGALITNAEAVTPAHNLVAEMMVIYNSAAAQIASRAEIPFFYRCLEDKIKIETDYDGNEQLIIPASVLTFQPVKHQAMGLEIYAQVTSPIRRYADLVNQRQLTALITKQIAPYSKDDLQSMLLHLNQTRRKIKQL